jgi:hypothetical protein
MVNIQVNRGETKLGVFSEEEIKDGLQSGRFLPTDIGWREGMTTWQRLADFPEFSATTAAPAAGAIVSATGLPWEQREGLGFVPAFVETLKLVLLNPTVAFAVMKKEGGLGEPLLYGVIGGSIGFIISLLWNLLFGSIGAFTERNPIASAIGAGVGMVICIILAPLFIVVCLFIGSGILHLCLMLVGGANRSFETTFRVVSYTVGSTNPLAVIPFCGSVVAAIWNIILECIGLAKAHEIPTGKAVLAVLLPVIVCCGFFVLLWVVVGVGIFSALMGHH